MKSGASAIQKAAKLDRVELELGAPRPMGDVIDAMKVFAGFVPDSGGASLDCRITAQGFTLSVPYTMTVSDPQKLVLPYPDGFPVSVLQGMKKMSRTLASLLAVSYLRNTLDCLVQLQNIKPAVYSPPPLVSDVYHPYSTPKNPKPASQKPSMNVFRATGLVYRLKS